MHSKLKNAAVTYVKYFKNSCKETLKNIQLFLGLIKILYFLLIISVIFYNIDLNVNK